jgi:hypothetical protein
MIRKQGNSHGNVLYILQIEKCKIISCNINTHGTNLSGTDHEKVIPRNTITPLAEKKNIGQKIHDLFKSFRRIRRRAGRCDH